jgi:predicted kinase
MHQDHIVTVEEGSLVILSGLPAAGKSSLKSRAKGFHDLDSAWLSMDNLRRNLAGSTQDLDGGQPFERIPQHINTVVAGLLRTMVRTRLAHGRTVILDATNVNDAERKTWAELAEEVGAPVQVLIFDVSVEECLTADATRVCRVGEAVIKRMAERPAPPPLVKKDGTLVAQTPPQGFVKSSKWPYQLVTRKTWLQRVSRQLPTAKVDVVGDVHGLLPDLLLLLSNAGWSLTDGHLQHSDPERKVLFLGDLVDRGPDSMGVLRLVRQGVLDGKVICLKGNHEEKLVRFLKQAKAGTLQKWRSFANATTGTELLKERDCEVLMTFMHTLPAYYLYDEAGISLAFVHGDMNRFDENSTPPDEMVYGQSGYERRVDSDAQYEEKYRAGFNTRVLFRGHIPQTSPQEHVFSLEREPYQKGELVLLRLDGFLADVRAGKTNAQAFHANVMTQATEYDFEAVSARWALAKGMNALVQAKLVTGSEDASQLLRVFKYSKATFWDNKWGESPWLIKARGLVLDTAGQIVSHPFDKCFNYKENGAGLDLSPDLDIVVSDKLNGFLGLVSGHPFKSGRLLAHTQGSFGGDFVGYIEEFLNEDKHARGLIHQFLANNKVTLMFEVLHPEDPHIIDYPASMMGLHLIGIRGLNLTDTVWTEHEIDKAASEMGLRRVAWCRMKLKNLLALCRDDQGLSKVEGWMARADTEDQPYLFKLKTPYYLVTKFLGRLSETKVRHLFGNPQDFRKKVDEEFYDLIDLLVARSNAEKFLALSDTARVSFVRELVDELL